MFKVAKKYAKSDICVKDITLHGTYATVPVTVLLERSIQSLEFTRSATAILYTFSSF